MAQAGGLGRERALRWLPLAFGIAGALGLGAWLQLAWQQIFHPLELFGHEGVIVDHVARLLHGEAIYGPPELTFVPFLYTPGYYWLCAAFSWLGDLAFVVPRAVSALSTLVAMGCLTLMVVRAGGNAVWGIAGVGVYALAASQVEAWYALTQVDSLLVAVLALAMAGVQSARTASQWFAVGALFALAFWCKQSGVLAGLIVALVMAAASLRHGLAIVAGMAAGIAPPLAWIALAGNDWFFFYVFAIPAGFGQDLAKLALLLRYDVPPLLPAGVLGLWLLVLLWRQEQRDLLLRYIAVGAALAGTAIAGRLHVGGHVNTLMPALLLMALLLGIGGSFLWQRGGLESARRWARPLVAVLLALQFALVSDDFSRFRPASTGVAVAAEMRTALAGARKPLLLPGLGYLVGEPAGADPVAVNDVMRISPSRARPFLEALERAMIERRFGGVVLEDFLRRRYQPLYGEYYRAVGPLTADSDAIRPRAGLDFGAPWLLESR